MSSTPSGGKPEQPPSHDPAAVPLDEWSGDDLEQLYQNALEAVDAVETEIELSRILAAESREGNGELTAELAGDLSTASAAVSTIGNPMPAVAARPVRSTSNLSPADPNAAVRERLLPEQVIEAALFVGGQPLSTKKLASLLRSDAGHEPVETAVERLNRRYAEQGRPYEIRLGVDGYRMSLKPEFERVSQRVHGYGPKEVKLSQESLEILALIAYRQPLTAEQIEEAGRPNPGGVLRQLLRRELIVIERGDPPNRDVAYRTTPRFLDVFGIHSLDELPQADELDLK